MTAALTATADPSNSPPRVLLDVTGMAGSTVTITRTDPDGNTQPVRTANPGTLVGGAFTVFDYEARYGVVNTYTATSDTADTATATATLTVGAPWLIHPGNPALSMPLRVISRGPRTKASTAAAHVILGRRDPIVVTDGVRHAASFDLNIGTQSVADEAALDALLADAATLLLQLVYTGIDRAEYWWVSVGDVTETDVVEWFGNEVTQWTLPCTVTSAPSGSQQSERTWADLLADFATWADADAAYATWHDLLVDSRV